jgi:hypothetical protein
MSVWQSLSLRVAPNVRNEVDLAEAGTGLVPLRGGAYRDLCFEQAPGLGSAATFDMQALAVWGEDAIDRRRRDGHEFGSHAGSSSSSPCRSSAPMISLMNGASRLPQGLRGHPDLYQRIDHHGVVDHWPGLALARLARSRYAIALRAWRLVHPVRAQSSSRIAPFSAFGRCLMSRCDCSSSPPCAQTWKAPSSDPFCRITRRVKRTFSGEALKGFRGYSGESTRRIKTSLGPRAT